MLEEKIDALTAAVKENTAAILGKGGAAAPAAGAKGPGRPAGATAKPKFTAEQVKAAVVGVKESKGTDVAKALISDAGAKDLADLLTKSAKFADVMAACEAALAEEADEEAVEDDL